MIYLKDDMLTIRFPEVHRHAHCAIEFQRTLRIPDDNRDYPLPPGLGRFPLQRVDDFKAKVPEPWHQHGGVFLPMYQAEALWICFNGTYPCAIKVATGRINAVTGEPWNDGLSPDPQDYMVVPDQPWLDGYAVAKGLIRQFVAMPLGEDYTAEEQLAGEARHGGMQILVCPMKADVYERYRRQHAEFDRLGNGMAVCYDAMDMGLAPGGLMRQEIYEDHYGIDAWDQNASARCFAHIVNSLHYREITDSPPPHETPTAEQYTRAGLPWFEYYAADRKALAGAKKLAGLDSVAAKKLKKGEGVLTGNTTIGVQKVIDLSADRTVREGSW